MPHPPQQTITPRQRVKTALRHETPDRTPVDFLATLEIWDRLAAQLQPDVASVGPSDFFDPAYEALLRHFEVDCRVFSYDQFCNPPDSILHPGATVEWWDVLSRSTPSRMWRQKLPDGTLRSIWGQEIRVVETPTGAYEEFARYPLSQATSLSDLKSHPWPEPDWWDFSALPGVIQQLDTHQEYHLRFRIGSIFETAWQLRGMQEFLMDLALQLEIPLYIMDRLTEVYVEYTRQIIELVGDRLDMLYFYDDVATQSSLMISHEMWQQYIRPRQAQLTALAQANNIPVMYHCDGAIYPLLPQLLELGIDLLNPVQADATGMEPARLKAEFGDRLSFHGGIDIIKTLPRGTVADVRAEVKERVRVLGDRGGYIMASSHHIQSDTPLENIVAMYDPALRLPAEPSHDETVPSGSSVPIIPTTPQPESESRLIVPATGVVKTEIEGLLDDLYEAVLDGQQSQTKAAVWTLLALAVNPDTILYEGMIPAMSEIGRQFEQGTCFVPEMLVSAHAMQGGLDILRPLLAQGDSEPLARVALGTIQSDIHNIGKNMVGMMLEGAGFEVVDLGVDVPPAKFVEAAQNGADLIAISALLTTTMTNIPLVIQALTEAGLRDRVKIIIGGAPITQEFADQIGADGFAADANQAVRVSRCLLGLG